MPEQPPVGVVGLGLLGEALARRLLHAGFAVLGFDLDPAKTAKLEELGGRAATSIGAIGASCQTILIAVFSTEQVEAVVERELLPAIGDGSGRLVLCASTCDPNRLGRLGESAAARGLRVLETPISGSSGQVARGEGVALIGGDRDLLAAAQPILRALFAAYFHIGKTGDGGRTKLAVNLILGLNRLALAEGLVFATRVGLDPAAFLTVAKESAAYSQIMDVKGAKMLNGMLNGDFTPEGRVRQTLKDVHLMLEQAKRHGQTLPLLNVHCDVLEACVRAGEADLDNSAVINEIARRQTLSR